VNHRRVECRPILHCIHKDLGPSVGPLLKPGGVQLHHYALAVAVSGAGVPRRESLFEDKKMLTIVTNGVLLWANDLTRRLDRWMIRLDVHFKEGSTGRKLISLTGFEHCNVTTSHLAMRLARPELDCAKRDDHAIATPRAGLRTRRYVSRHANVIVVEHRGLRLKKPEKQEQSHKDLESLSEMAQSLLSCRFDGKVLLCTFETETGSKTVYCPDCGKENPSGQKFCRSCGLSLKPVSQALAGEVVPADGPVSPNANSTVVVQGAQRFWQNPLIYALLLVFLGIGIAFFGDNVLHTKTISDIGMIVALLGIGLLGFKGVMLVITPPSPSAGSHPSPQIEETSRLTPALLSAEPASITENTTRQLDTGVARDKKKSRDTQPTV